MIQSRVQIYRNIAETEHKVKKQKAGRTINHANRKAENQTASDKSSDRKEASYGNSEGKQATKQIHGLLEPKPEKRKPKCIKDRQANDR